MGAKWMGATVVRKEDPALLRGEGQFVDDIDLPGMAHAAFVRSPHAHALLRGIDSTAARAMPGVLCVLTAADLPEPLRSQDLPLYVPNPAISQCRMPQVLVREEARFCGEPVAIVVAENRYLAEDAAMAVVVEYEVLPPISDCAAAVEPGAARAHRGAADNIAARVPIRVGDIDAAFAGAAHVFRERIFQHRGGPFSIETRGIVCAHDRASDLLSVHISCQGAHRIKRSFMDMMDLGDHQVRVIAPDVGGGFGPKGAFYPEYGAAAAAALRLRRPVKWIEDRRENFLATHQERDQYWDVELATDAQGVVRGMRGRLVHDCGAYLPWGLVLPWIAATTVPGPYQLPAYHLELVAAYTNKISCTPVRGAGRPQAVFVMERMMDAAARGLGLDRAEIRRRNFIRPEQMPYKVGIVFRDGRPVTYDSGDYPATQQAALAYADWDGFAGRQRAALRQGRHIGIGLSNAVEGTGLGPFEGATVRVSTTGRVTVSTGATPQGQSHKTTLAQLAAEQLGIDPELVTVITGDTATISLGMGTFASRTAVNAGNSVHLAAIEVGHKLRRVAAEMMEVAEADLELVNGGVQVKGVPGMRKSFREIAWLANGAYGVSMPADREPGLESTIYFKPDQSTYANSTHVAEVEVDIETGQVRILRHLVMHDCGSVINPLVVEGQVIGGVAHGVGNALFEWMRHDDEAQPLTTNFADYLLPTAAEMPRVETHHGVTPSPLNPLGVKGAGEGGTIAAIAAIASAIENALAPFGAHVTCCPLTPAEIVRLVGASTNQESRNG